MPRSATGSLLPELLAALQTLDERVALVFDDVHHLEAQPVLGVLRGLVEGLRAGPRLVLISRTDPPLPLGRLRLSGELAEVREQELRFTHAEAADLLARLLPAALAPELVAQLEARTEGWAAGLRMAAIALERAADPAAVIAAFAGSHRFVMDYLLEEALGRQDEALQRFLMETAILPRFTAAACTAVTGDAQAPRRLHEAERRNLFLVALDDERTWYRYHHLFAELLQFRLRRLHPERLDALRERASRWFEAQGDVQEALQQAAGMSTPDRLVQMLDVHGYPLLSRSEFGSFARWLRYVPEPLAQPCPMFLVALAWFHAQTDRAPHLPPLLRAIEAAVAAPPPGYAAERAEEARLHCQALHACALRIADRFDEALATRDRVLQQLPPGATVVRGVLRFNMAAIHLRLAEMAPARRLLEQSFEANLCTGVFYLVLASLGHLGAVLAHTDGVGAARQRLETAVAFAERQRLASVPAFGIVLYQLAQVHYLADELDAARALLERAASLTAAERETDIRANVLLHLARVETAAGRWVRAAALPASSSSSPFEGSAASGRTPPLRLRRRPSARAAASAAVPALPVRPARTLRRWGRGAPRGRAAPPPGARSPTPSHAPAASARPAHAPAARSSRRAPAAPECARSCACPSASGRRDRSGSAAPPWTTGPPSPATAPASARSRPARASPRGGRAAPCGRG